MSDYNIEITFTTDHPLTQDQGAAFWTQRGTTYFGKTGGAYKWTLLVSGDEGMGAVLQDVTAAATHIVTDVRPVNRIADFTGIKASHAVEESNAAFPAHEGND